MIDYPFINCYNPHTVFNRFIGQNVKASCGVCKACLMNRANKMSMLCSLEEQEHRYCYFVNPSYSPEFLPVMRPVPDELGGYRLVSECERLGDSGRVLGYSHYDAGKMSMFLSKCKLDGLIGYVSMRDVQLFLKRLRKNLSKYTDEKIRYYAVSEYGPKTFRPHYHFLFFFDDPKTLAVFLRCVRASWPYGRIVSSLSRGKCSSYVARYVNSSVSLPRLFAYSSCRPFSCHSRFFALGFYKGKRKEIYEDAPESFMSQRRSVGSRVVEFSPWRSLTSYFFPKCKDFNRKSYDELCYTYTVLRPILQTFGEHLTVMDCVYRVMDFYNDFIAGDDGFYPRKRSLSRVFGCRFVDAVEWLFSNCKCWNSELPESDSSFSDEYSYQYTKSCIYSQLWLSHRFLYFCCSDPDDPACIRYALDKIIDFYKFRDYKNLRNWYISMEAYSAAHPHNLLGLLCYYDNLAYDIPSPDDDASYFEHLAYSELSELTERFVSSIDLTAEQYAFLHSIEFSRSKLPRTNSILKNLDIYKAFVSDKEFEFRDSIKHKELNDLNGFWTYD